MSQKTVSVFGLGYVGLPLLCLLAQKGYKAIGVDIDQLKIKRIRQGKSPFRDSYVEKTLPLVIEKINVTEKGEDAVKRSDVILVCIPTPLGKEDEPDLIPLKAASKSISKGLQKGQLIIIESTIFPGTIEDIVEPILADSGLKAGTDYYLAHCPERIDPGNEKWTVMNLPRVCGAMSKEGAQKTVEFYNTIVNAEVIPLSSTRAAEATKIVENAFRDINIAFVNELAQSFDILGLDAVEIIRAASTKPFAFLPHYPGAGVGGHCIPVDPYYLIKRAEDFGFDHSFLKLAREINRKMPNYVVNILEKALDFKGKSLRGTKIGILGISFKKNIDDSRNSPYFSIYEALKAKRGVPISFDPHLPKQSDVSSLKEIFSRVEAIILVTDHVEFVEMDLSMLENTQISVLVDGRNCLDRKEIEKYGIFYCGIGRGSIPQSSLKD